MEPHHSLQRRPGKIFIIFYHGTVDVLPPVLGLRHEKIQNSLSAPPSSRCSLFSPARSNRTRAPHSAGTASFPGGCSPAAAAPAEGVRIYRGSAFLNFRRESIAMA